MFKIQAFATFFRQIEAPPIEHWAGWAPGPVCKSGKIFAPTSFRRPDRPAHTDNQTYIKVLI